MNDSQTDDIVLRCFGFRIHSRPKEGSPIWKRGAKSYTYVEAMEECRRLLACRIEELKGYEFGVL